MIWNQEVFDNRHVQIWIRLIFEDGNPFPNLFWLNLDDDQEK